MLDGMLRDSITPKLYIIQCFVFRALTKGLSCFHFEVNPLCMCLHIQPNFTLYMQVYMYQRELTLLTMNSNEDSRWVEILFTICICYI